MSALLARLKKSSVVDRASELGKSELFKNKNFIKTHVPMMNLAFSGKLHGGFANGLIQLAGPSKHFKSNMALVLVRAFQDKYEDGIVIFYDSEFGSSEAYFEAAGVDVDRVLHVPLLNIEEFKMDCIKQLDELGKDDRVMILVDSVGNLASKKELDDALDGKSVADMTRAKQLKACFRMITPYLTLKNVAMVCINHSYQCGTADMEVVTPDGVKSLADFQVGDIVLTTNGWEPVSNVFAYDEAWITDVELEDGTVLSFTAGHRFMVNGEWIYVEDLKEGMDLDIKLV